MACLSKKSSLAMVRAGFDSVAMTVTAGPRDFAADYSAVPLDSMQQFSINPGLSRLSLLSGREAAFAGAGVSGRIPKSLDLTGASQ